MQRLLQKLFSRCRRSVARAGQAKKKFRPMIETLEDRRLMTAVSSPNPYAPIIPNVQIETVYFGSAWAGKASNPAQSAELAAEAKDLNGFFSAITGSHYMDALSQYYCLNSYGSTIRPGYGQFAKADFVPGQMVSGQTIPESVIQTMLANEIQSGNLDAPNGNTLYMVFMPPGVSEAGDLGGPRGHHSSFAYGGGYAYFATIEHPTTQDPATGKFFQPVGAVGTETTFQFMTEVASHEMVEAISDPMGNVPGDAAWWDRNQGDNTYRDEIGDIAQDNPPSGGTMALEGTNGAGYVVQKYWSNQANNSVAPGPGASDFKNLNAVPYLANFDFGLTDQNGRTIGGSWGDLTSSNGDGSQVSFAGTFDGQPVAVSVQAQVGQKLNVQIRSKSDGQLVFSGIISQPSGDWWNVTDTDSPLAPGHVELSGTVFKSGQGLQAFGTGGYIVGQPFSGALYGSSFGGSGCGPGDGPNGQFNNYNSTNPLHHHYYD
jgi:hypothetical protein